MLIRSIALIFVASSFVLVAGQIPDSKPAKTGSETGSVRLRDIPFSNGVDTQFIIKELARDINLNVLFDTESFRVPRKTFIELRNVTAVEALNYIFLNEGLISEEVGPKTIMIANRFRGTSIPQIGVGVTWLTDQLAQYFGAEPRALLINDVRPDSPALKAGLKAGDVIAEVDGIAVSGSLSIQRMINAKNDSEVVLKVIRNRKPQTVSVTVQQGIK